MPRIKKEFKRPSGCRDARLFVIAAEGQRTEHRYFNDLKVFYRNHRILVELIKRKNSASSPMHVIKDLNSFKYQYKLRQYDELWMVIDKDRWGDRNIGVVAAQCAQKKYNLAVSNPCFEVWILLHLKDISLFTQDKKDRLFRNPNSYLEKEIRNILGSYNKNNPDTTQLLPHVDKAIISAKKLDLNPSHRWPNYIGTRVYIIAERIIHS